ncbi:uncharacterized protein LOC100845719 [Brachypodium distachyon]|uniref:Dirigent protein n=1 Tax=Brachypodium distachyon TaxID=15368 RepID=I1IK16_BRADI|nr:uncharacterized protein LOC100845719 [Brachypodium distachyon]KQJ87618.1 hypothetical protein BRADI_4g12340v3 [Brachypodium distachyon]|eukprot:XP_014758089.1 uncharacterized protein LOC100845719 [Brachypodium distachyon]
MANFQMKSYSGPSWENGQIDFPSLYLRRLDSGDKKNQHVVIDGFGSTDLGQTSIVDCGIYDGADDNANLVARAKGMRMNADHSWCNLFVIVFELDGFKGSTLAVMGATMEKASETSIEEKGEWAIVGGTGEFAMARGLIKRKGRQMVSGGEILELSLEVYCRTTKVAPRPAIPTAVASPAPAPVPIATRPPPPVSVVRAPKEYGPKGHPGSNPNNFDPKRSSRLKSVRTYHYFGVNGIKFTYTDTLDGQEHYSLIGNLGFGRSTAETVLEILPNEWVTKVSGTYGSHMDSRHGRTRAIYSLILETNLGRKLQATGNGRSDNGDGASFSIVVDGNETTLGFFGQNNGYGPINIGIYTVPN